MTDEAAGTPGPQERSKTVTWQDPAATVSGLAGRTGLEFLEAIAAGVLPAAPIMQLFGSRIVSVTWGEVVFACVPDESVYNPIGVVHGGLVCTLLDSVCGCAVQSTLPLGTGYTSLEIKVSYLRPVHAHSGELTAHGWVTRRGRRASFAEGDVRTADGKLVATATSTCLVFPL